jgi:hypothetical protein
MGNCFLHVPKTGGSWLSAAIRTSLPPHEFYEVPSERVGHVPVSLLLKRYSVVAGHFSVAQLPPYLGETFTVLRDPVDRVVSLYHFYREQLAAPHLDPRVATAQALDFDAFVNQLRNRVSPWSNWQTFLFSGAADCETPAEGLLAAALDNLNRLKFVGVHDELGDGLRVLGALHGWRMMPPVGRVNATKQRIAVRDLAPSILRKLRSLNEADEELFQRARDRWVSIRDGDVRPTSVGRPVPSPLSASAARAMEMGTKQIVITNAYVDARSGVVVVRAQSFVTAENVTVGIRISDAVGVVVYGVNTHLLGQQIAVEAGSTLEVAFRLNQSLTNGEYRLTAAVHEGADHLEGCYHWIDEAARFECRGTNNNPISDNVDVNATAETRVIA